MILVLHLHNYNIRHLLSFLPKLIDTTSPRATGNTTTSATNHDSNCPTTVRDIGCSPPMTTDVEPAAGDVTTSLVVKPSLRQNSTPLTTVRHFSGNTYRQLRTSDNTLLIHFRLKNDAGASGTVKDAEDPLKTGTGCSRGRRVGALAAGCVRYE